MEIKETKTVGKKRMVYLDSEEVEQILIDHVCKEIGVDSGHVEDLEAWNVGGEWKIEITDSADVMPIEGCNNESELIKAAFDKLQ